MKKRVILSLSLFLVLSFSYPQVIERLGETDLITYSSSIVTSYPSDTYVDEVNDVIYCKASKRLETGIIDFSNEIEVAILGKENARTATSAYYKIGDFAIHYSDIAIEIIKDDVVIKNLAISTGISFILKKGGGYIVYYVDKNGVPGAVDTEGVIYTSAEAMEYLKAYDSEKYAESLERAEELGLKTQFLNNEVLVWGKTYYSTTQILGKQYEKNDPYIRNGLIQYDQNGYGYQMAFDPDKILFCVVNPNGLNEMVKVFTGAELLLIVSREYSSSWYVGFGGNIYYYVAGEDYTEVFRIRRTWGEPDFYAMAINGYTDDDYGAYVNEVLAGLSKADLRLLRNTVFALYGYHFNSADLASYFDRQVWYNDEGRTTADITLPEHRARLVEMIQEKEAEL
ncbi:MAG: YARHG domain-containing protein [Treponema sp.]|nr:YARHG domain-containing protein [Candidatus Treponema caballi]